VSIIHDSGKVDLPTAFFSCFLNDVVLLSPPLSKYFQLCLHDVAHVLACIIIFRQCLALQGLQEAAPIPTFSLWFCSLLRIHVSRSLSFLSELVCDLLPKRLFHGSPKAHCQKSILVTILTSTAWRTPGLFGSFPTLVGGHH